MNTESGVDNLFGNGVLGHATFVEIKSVELLAPVHKKQLLTYLRLADKRLGLLVNFHVVPIKDGITRIVNGLEDDDHAKVAKPQRSIGRPRQPLLGISRAQPLAIFSFSFSFSLRFAIGRHGGTRRVFARPLRSRRRIGLYLYADEHPAARTGYAECLPEWLPCETNSG